MSGTGEASPLLSSAPSIELLRIYMRAIVGEAQRFILGHADAVELVTLSLLAGGHVLLEGPPGAGKGLIARAVAEICGLNLRHLYMTADLEATHLLDEASAPTNALAEEPLEASLAHVVLADDIEQSPPRTQSILFRAMEEPAITLTGRTWRRPSPFTVIATRDRAPVRGPHPLTERQLDRFMMRLSIDYPSARDLARIVGRTTSPEPTPARRMIEVDSLRRIVDLVRQVPVARHVTDYAVRLVLATNPEDPSAPPGVRRYVVSGASPRGARSLVLAAKAAALIDGRYNVAFDDVRSMLHPTLSHRITRTAAALKADVSADVILWQVLRSVREEPTR